MTQMTSAIADEVRKHIRIEATGGRLNRAPADVVSDALVHSGIDVRRMSLDDWKELIFDAFQTARREV